MKKGLTMKNKKILAIFFCLLFCFTNCINVMSLSENDSFTADITYDFETSNLYISGIADCQQIIIRINKLDTTVPVTYTFVKTINGEYSYQRSCTSLPEDNYIIIIENSDNGINLIKYFSNINESSMDEYVKVIMSYTENKNAQSLTVEQLLNLKLYNIIESNLIYYKNAIENSTVDEVDSRSEIQNLIIYVNAEHSENTNALSAIVSYNYNDKCVVIKGTSTDPQVIIKITKSSDISPLLYTFIDVEENKFEKNISWSIYEAGEYYITIENIDSGDIITTEFKNYDNIPPVITINEYIKTPTNEDITVTASVNEGTLNATSHTFAENGSFEFIATDEYGNQEKKTVTIDNIDKIKPVITGAENNKYYNKDITITFDEGTADINGDNLTSGNIVTSEGKKILTVTDAAGNISTVSFVIDKTYPKVNVKDQNNNTVTTNSTVYTKATIQVSDDNIETIVLEKDGTVITMPSTGIIDTEGNYEITATDKADNTTNFSFKLVIVKEIKSNQYNVNQTDNIISKITAGTTVTQLLANIDQTEVKVYKDNVIITGSSLISTGSVIKLMNGNITANSYTIIITGDINGDGKINVSDMIQIKSQILNIKKLEGGYSKAADTNNDGKINITDFIQIKSHILGRSSITPRSY